MWIFKKEDSYPYIRFLVGHNKKRKYMDIEGMKDSLKKHGIYVSVDKIQAK